MSSNAVPCVHRLIPVDDGNRVALHEELLSRPQARMGLPVQVASLVVLNGDSKIEDQLNHLAQLSGRRELTKEALQRKFLRIQVGASTLRWEHHNEFTRYTLIRALPPSTLLNDPPQTLLSQLLLEHEWFKEIPGKTLLAIHLIALAGEPPNAISRATAYDHWFSEGEALGSMLGSTAHSSVVTDFKIHEDGFERMLILAAPGVSEVRLGRVAQRLLEIETYRLLALRALPVSRSQMTMLQAMESELSTITQTMNRVLTSDRELLDALVPLAARLESAISEHRGLFDASQAYYKLVDRRLEELHEKAIPGTQMFGDFLQRRLAPAMNTVASTSQRMADLSLRIANTAGLLRTRVDITAQDQARQLQETLSSIRILLLRLQGMAKVLTIAAIVYYGVNLFTHIGRALQAAGLRLEMELIAGALIPLLSGGAWFALWRINKRIRSD